MASLMDRIRTRLLPAALTAAGISLVAAGLLGYSDPTAARAPSLDPLLSPSPGASSSLLQIPSFTPQPSASAAAAPRVATRVVIPALGIDLPVLRGTDAFPLCDAAMYLADLHQPGQKGATYIYAHARVGMFLPILNASKIDNGKRMIGMIVQVFTSDDVLFLYEVIAVRRHQTSLNDAIAATTPQLWLQTSEGINQTFPKVQLVAKPLSSIPADHGQAHPVGHPYVCS